MAKTTPPAEGTQTPPAPETKPETTSKAPPAEKKTFVFNSAGSGTFRLPWDKDPKTGLGRITTLHRGKIIECSQEEFDGLKEHFRKQFVSPEEYERLRQREQGTHKPVKKA